MQKPTYFALSCLVLLNCAGVSRASNLGIDIRHSLVRITATYQTPNYQAPWDSGGEGRGVGSGFILPGHRIMTNAHVVSNAKHIVLDKDSNDQPYPAHVLFVAHDCDLALLTVDDPAFFDETQPLGFGDIPQLDTTVYACGYPIGGERMSITRGVVSRIEFRTYSHSSLDSHLTIQIDAAINPGNSGGPVVQDGKVVGVAFQGYSGAVAQNTGYMIPTPVISRFLTDIEDDRYDGYVELAVNYMNLQNPSYRAQMGLAPDIAGVVVTGVLSAGSAIGRIENGDVLLSIDGHRITNDGHIRLGDEYVQLEEVVERKFHGDVVRFEILRDGQQMTVDVTLRGAWPYTIFANHYDQLPRFVLFAGLLFQPMSRNFIQAHKIKDLDILYHYHFFVTDEIYLERPEVVVLSDILADPINTWFETVRGSIIDEINGRQIHSLDDVAAAFAAPAERYVIRVLGGGLPLVIEADKLAAARDRILNRYNITVEQRLGDASSRPWLSAE